MYDCIIAGGGLIGMLTARSLAKEGCSVLVLDKGTLGGESSWAGGGILSPLYPWRYPDSVSRLAAYSQKRYHALAESLYEESGVDPEWIRSGLLILDGDEQAQASHWAKSFNASMTSIDDCAAINKLEPGLSPGQCQANWLPDVAQLRNPRLMKSMIGSLAHYGVDAAENEAVITIEQNRGHVVAVRTGSRRIATNKLIVTSGAWSAELLGQTSTSINVEPVRGQMMVFKAEPGMINHIILDKDNYLIPRRDGRVLIGSTLEYVGFDKSTTENAKSLLWQRAIELAPDLSQCKIEKHWAGLRPGTKTGVPYIGPHPQIQGLYVNAGHFRNGVVLGLASVELLVDIMMVRPPALNPEPYSLQALVH